MKWVGWWVEFGTSVASKLASLFTYLTRSCTQTSNIAGRVWTMILERCFSIGSGGKKTKLAFIYQLFPQISCWKKDKFNIQHMILISDNHLWFEVEPGSFGKAVCIQLKTLGHLKINIFLGQEIRNIFYNVSNTNENWRDICTRLETNVPWDPIFLWPADKD